MEKIQYSEHAGVGGGEGGGLKLEPMNVKSPTWHIALYILYLSFCQHNLEI